MNQLFEIKEYKNRLEQATLVPERTFLTDFYKGLEENLKLDIHEILTNDEIDWTTTTFDDVLPMIHQAILSEISSDDLQAEWLNNWQDWSSANEQYKIVRKCDEFIRFVWLPLVNFSKVFLDEKPVIGLELPHRGSYYRAGEIYEILFQTSNLRRQEIISALSSGSSMLHERIQNAISAKDKSRFEEVLANNDCDIQSATDISYFAQCFGFFDDFALNFYENKIDELEGGITIMDLPLLFRNYTGCDWLWDEGKHGQKTEQLYGRLESCNDSGARLSLQSEVSYNYLLGTACYIYKCILSSKSSETERYYLSKITERPEAAEYFKKWNKEFEEEQKNVDSVNELPQTQLSEQEQHHSIRHFDKPYLFSHILDLVSESQRPTVYGILYEGLKNKLINNFGFTGIERQEETVKAFYYMFGKDGCSMAPKGYEAGIVWRGEMNCLKC